MYSTVEPSIWFKFYGVRTGSSIQYPEELLEVSSKTYASIEMMMSRTPVFTSLNLNTTPSIGYLRAF